MRCRTRRSEARAAFLVRLFVLALVALLLGYAVAGKSAAYLGIRPVYVSELVLALGLAVCVVSPRLRLWLWRPDAPTLALLLLCAWGAARTIPYVSRYGMDAFRDAALWGYAAFALVMRAIVGSSEAALRMIVRRFRQFALAYPMIMALALYVGPSLWPALAMTGSPLFMVKLGDIAVYLAATTVAGMIGVLPLTGIAWPVWLAACGAVLLRVVAGTRGGALAVLSAWGVTGLLLTVRVPRAAWSRLWKAARWIALLAVAVLVLSIGSTSNLASRLGIRPETLYRKYASIVGPTDYTGTKSDRLRWWTKIVGYTFGGEYFWQGKGYGINLALDDGFDWHYTAEDAGTLRSPHNGHLTFLARGGVPGFALWLLTQGAWMAHMVRAYLSACRWRDMAWSSWFCVVIAFWTAAMVNASFDVYLEGPMGGIWYWVVFGVGLGSVLAYRRTRRVALIPKRDR